MRKTIYKKDSKGKVRYLTLETVDENIHQTSGLMDGKASLTISACTAKNIGKSNETTASEQAVLELIAKIKDKLTKGYYQTLEELEEGNIILPMLAQEYGKYKSKIRYPCYVQPKLDGMRALGDKSLISRTNKPIETLPHIVEELKRFDGLVDGELYAHGLSFQKNMKVIKKNRPESIHVKFHVYDMVRPYNFGDRFSTLKDIVEHYELEHIVIVPTFIIHSEEELREKHSLFLSQGYEGTMIRHGDTVYEQGKRSTSLLKFKDFLDESCEIVAVEASERRPEQGSFICRLEDGQTFGCGMRFTHAEREHILSHSEEYIGQIAEIRFFEYTDGGVPRFPVCVGIRLDK